MTSDRYMPTSHAWSRSQRAGVAAVALSVFAWGASAVLVKSVSVGGLTLAFWRLWAGVAFMLLLLAATGRRLTRVTMRASIVGGIGFGTNIAFYFSAVKLTSIVDATLIGSLTPVLVVAVAAPLLGERISPHQLGLAALAVAATVVVVLGGAGSAQWSLAGDLLAVGALVTYTVYFLVSKVARAGSNSGFRSSTPGLAEPAIEPSGPGTASTPRTPIDTLEYLTGVTLVAALVVTPVTLVSGTPVTGMRGLDYLYLGLIVVFPGAIGHGMMNWALRYVDAWLASVMTVGVPVVAAAAAALVLRERVTLVQWGAGAVVVGVLGILVLLPEIQARAAAAPVVPVVEPG